MSTEIILRNLGALAGSQIGFSEPANAFLTQGYTSLANNTYFNAIRFSEGIIIKEDIGQGYSHTFLNALRIYSFKDKTLLADRSYHCVFYSKEKVYNEAKSMLLKLISEAANSQGFRYNSLEAETTINKILNEAIYGDQWNIAQSQIRKALTA